MAVPSLRLYRVRRAVVHLLADRRGATAIEYGLILAFVVLAMFVALSELGSTTSRMWDNVSAKVGNVS